MDWVGADLENMKLLNLILLIPWTAFSVIYVQQHTYIIRIKLSVIQQHEHSYMFQRLIAIHRKTSIGRNIY
jgi:hypothetical protein